MHIIEITGISGHSPYDIYVCDITNTYCYVVDSGVVSVPPFLYLNLPTQLSNVNQVLIKIIDSEGCNVFQYVACPVTPTPTPTNTLTPTPTPTNANCVCLTFTNQSEGTLNYGYTNCNNITINSTITPLVTIYVCGKNPTYDEGIVVTSGPYCISEVCPPPSPTPSVTPTTLSVVCFAYTYSGVGYYETISNVGYYNSKPYYELIQGYVWYNTISSLWVWSTAVGGGVTLDTLNNGGLFYPYCCSFSPFYPNWDNINSPSDFISTSSVGGCT